jgi:nucleoside-diphosphate-sugar epimerase
MRVFVTGASGVIGQKVVPALLANGHFVTAAGRASRRLDALRDAGASVATLDIVDGAAAQRAMEGHDVVINVATHVPKGSHMFFPGAWKEMDHVRREASRTLTDAATRAGVKRFIQESFAPIYPDSGDEWITEKAPVRVVRYNRSILDAEHSAERFAQNGGVAVVLRFALLYGPGDLFSVSVLDTVRRGWMPMLGRRNGFVSMVTHHDAAAAVVAALTVPTATYNVVDDEPMTRAALGAALAAMLHVREPRFLPPWFAKLGGSLGETIARSLRISNRKLKEASHWSPSYPSMREGFRAVLDASSRD